MRFYYLFQLAKLNLDAAEQNSLDTNHKSEAEWAKIIREEESVDELMTKMRNELPTAGSSLPIAQEATTDMLPTNVNEANW